MAAAPAPVPTIKVDGQADTADEELKKNRTDAS